MKILVVINDMRQAHEEYTHTGVMRNVNRRAVELELTEEQVKKIGIQDFETVESVSMTLETKVENQEDDLNF